MSKFTFHFKKPAFSAVDETRSLLLENLFALDFCSSGLYVDIYSPEVSCNDTIFDVKVADPLSGEVNSHQFQEVSPSHRNPSSQSLRRIPSYVEHSILK